MHDGVTPAPVAAAQVLSPVSTARPRDLDVQSTPSPVDRLYAWRDRMLAVPHIQRALATFPLTRPTARRHARAVFDLCAGFVYSQVLLACVRLDVFDILAERPLTLAELAGRLDLEIEPARRLVRAATSLGLLDQRRGDRIGLGMRGAALRGNPGAIAMIEHHNLLYADLADPIALLRGKARETRLSRYWPYAATADATALTDRDVADYTALMSRSQSLIAEDVLAAYDFGRHRRLLDVGGGDGTFLSAVAGRHAHLALTLFDLPAVARRAAGRLDAGPMGGRIEVFPGCFKSTPLPLGADVATLVRIALDHDDDTVVALCRAIHTALEPGGVLVLAEPMRELPGAEAVGDAYFGLYLLAMGRGRARSLGELTALLTRAGFIDVRAVPTRRELLTGLIIATRGSRT